MHGGQLEFVQGVVWCLVLMMLLALLLLLVLWIVLLVLLVLWMVLLVECWNGVLLWVRGEAG